MKLVTIPFSHFNERARWALQRFGVTFEEHGYLPMFHLFGVMRHAGLSGGRSDRVSTRLSTPVLMTEDGDRIRDSGQIVRYASDRYSTAETTLYPEDQRAEIEAIERRVHDHVGPHTRRLVYSYLLGDRALMRSTVRTNVGRIQAGLFVVLRPVLTLALRRALSITESKARRSEQRLRETVAELDEHLADGRRYLVGNRFSAADLTVASVLAPMLWPSRYGASLPPFDELPEGLRRFIGEMRATATGSHAMRIYEEERQAVVGARVSE